jgi:hypothetical protein
VLELEFEKTNGVLHDFDPNTEKNGEPYAYLTISTAQEADVLAFFEPTLKAFYFDENATRDLALGLRLRDDHQVFPHRRTEEMGGATLTVDYGIGNPMVLMDTALNSFELTPMDGGRVVVVFRAKVRLTEEQAGKVFMLQKKAITISVEPAELPELKEAA